MWLRPCCRADCKSGATSSPHSTLPDIALPYYALAVESRGCLFVVSACRLCAACLPV